MKIITQLNLFEDQELGDLEKILMVLDGLPETDFFDKLEVKRKHGRKDDTIQSYFMAYIAKIVLQLEKHVIIECCGLTIVIRKAVTVPKY